MFVGGSDRNPLQLLPAFACLSGPRPDVLDGVDELEPQLSRPGSMHKKVTPTANPKAAVGYVRVSTLEQAAHGISLEAQEERIRAYATLRGLDLRALVTDAGVSAGKYTLAERE